MPENEPASVPSEVAEQPIEAVTQVEVGWVPQVVNNQEGNTLATPQNIPIQLPEIGATVLLQFSPWGGVNLVSGESKDFPISPNNSVLVCKVEAIKTPKVTLE